MSTTSLKGPQEKGDLFFRHTQKLDNRERLPVDEYSKKEHRYLLNHIPDSLEISRQSKIRQGFFFDEDATITLIEEKSAGTEKYIVFEQRRGFRDKIFREISAFEFDELWQKRNPHSIEKTVLEASDGIIEAEISIYHGRFEGLNILKLQEESSSEGFFKPDWIGRDLSESPDFEEISLATNQSITIENLLEPTTRRQYFKRVNGLETDFQIPEVDLPDGFCKLWTDIRGAYARLNRNPENRKILIVAVAGGSGSGKTAEVTNFLEKNLRLNLKILPIDMYYRGASWMEEQKAQGNEFNWDQPEALNLPLLLEHLSSLKKGEKVVVPEYDFTTSEPKILDEVSAKEREIDPSEVEVIVIEGLFALNDILNAHTDYKAFVNASMETRLMRRMIRDVAERGRSPESILSAFINTVEKMHNEYIQPTINNADLILNNNYNPQVEAQNSGFHEIQQKYRTNYSVGELVEMGASFIRSEIQQDIYYKPQDKDPIRSGEILRLRRITPLETKDKENKKTVFTYKGPIIHFENTTMRPYFEAFIDELTEENFSNIFTLSQKTIEKERTFFEFEGAKSTTTFTLDEVYTVIDSKKIYIGTFIEIGKVLEKHPKQTRKSPFHVLTEPPYTERDAKQLEVNELIEALGLNNDIPIIRSYFSME